MPAHGHRCRCWTLGGLLAALAWVCMPAWGQSPKPEVQAASAAKSGPENSSLDAPLFYQLLIGEIELSAGHAGAAFEVVFDAAKRTRDEFFPPPAIEPDTITGLDTIVKDAVELKFTATQLTKEQLAELIQIPPR